MKDFSSANTASFMNENSSDIAHKEQIKIMAVSASCLSLVIFLRKLKCSAVLIKA